MTTVEDLLQAGSRDYLFRNGVPDEDDRTARQLTHTVIRRVLDGKLGDDGLVCSPLGVDWTDVFAAYLLPGERVDPAVLGDHGWVRLDALWHRLGRKDARDRTEWAVVVDGTVLAAVRIIEGSGHDIDSRRRDPVEAVLARARMHGEVRLREVLELRALVRAGHDLPASSPVLQAAADIEGGLGSRDLVRWTSGRKLAAPVAVAAGPAGRVRRMVVACSGVDGAGKSRLADELARSLSRAGVPVSQVWLRPGMGLGRVAALAGRVKRALGVDPRPGVGVVATDPEADVRSRRGALGWVWALLVTVKFVVGVRRQHAGSRGVVLWDRHVLDALTTLDFVYGGVDLRVPRLLVRRLLPAASVALYLDVPLEVALARKPTDLMGEYAVRRQLDAYARWLPELPGVRVLDARRPIGDLVLEALRGLAAPVGDETGHPA